MQDVRQQPHQLAFALERRCALLILLRVVATLFQVLDGYFTVLPLATVHRAIRAFANRRYSKKKKNNNNNINNLIFDKMPNLYHYFHTAKH